jgi:hypothetical protein
MGVDANSLYPSCFSSSVNSNIPYTSGQMYMPGRLLLSMKCETEKQKEFAINIINGKKELFITEAKLSSYNEVKDKFANFPPIMRNIEITNSKDMIGDQMYTYMKSNGMNVDNKSIKLTQLLETHLCKSSRNDISPTCFIDISSNYLWFLIDKGLLLKMLKVSCHFANILDLKDLLKNLCV